LRFLSWGFDFTVLLFGKGFDFFEIDCEYIIFVFYGSVKMDEKVKTELDNIVRTLADTGIVSQIFLFGSYARGEETPDSDIDLCVLTPVKDRRPIDLMADFRKKLWDVQTMPLDLLAFNHDDFYSCADSPISFEYEIAENGVLLYG
jgi:predicted nucleotidyltransferase